MAFSSLFGGNKLLKAFEGEIDAEELLKDKKAVALYFSGHWCPPCRGFTPEFAKWYTDDLKAKGLEVVFISSDKDDASFQEYFQDMPWLALPFAHRELKEKLSKKYKVQGIPTVVILHGTEKGDDGLPKVITLQGGESISKDPTGEKMPWIPPTFKEALGDKFLKGDAIVGLEAVEGKTLGLYFSAHWCPPCRGFTPKLAEWYAGLKGELGDKFEIVFCSADHEEDGMKSYFKEQKANGGDWLCLPWESKDNLDSLFEVQGIPHLVIVSPEGKVINAKARGLVGTATAAEFPWIPPPPLPIADLSDPEGINEKPSILIMMESVPEAKQKEILTTLEPMAKKYAAADEPELLFFAAKSSGGVADQIRTMCGLAASADQHFKSDKEADDSPSAPQLVRSISSTQPSVILLDIPDNGGYYVGQMSAAMDGSGVEQMIADWKAKKLERKQLARG